MLWAHANICCCDLGHISHPLLLTVGGLRILGSFQHLLLQVSLCVCIILFVRQGCTEAAAEAGCWVTAHKPERSGHHIADPS